MAAITELEEHDQVDRISNLPEEVQLKIVSMLPAEDGHHMSTLSKTWRSLPISYFLLNITIPDVWYMNKALTILQQEEQRLIGRFCLLGIIIESVCVDVDRWIKLVAKHRVKELMLIFTLGRYRFPPPCAFDEVMTSLVVLRLRGCILDKTLIQNKDTKFSCLKELVCWKVDLNGLLGEVLSRCPSLETLSLEDCTNFTLRAFDEVMTSLVVLKLRGCVLDKTLVQNKDTKFSCLKELECRKVDLNGLLGEVLSRCPSLETLSLEDCTNFTLRAFDEVMTSLVVLKLRGCVLVKTLVQNKDTKFSCLKELECRKVDLNGLLGEVLSRCPSLETLSLEDCTNFTPRAFDEVMTSLVVLKLRGCVLDKTLIQNKDTRFSCLKELECRKVDLNGLVLEEVVSRCPSLERLKLDDCTNFQRSEVGELSNKVDIQIVVPQADGIGRILLGMLTIVGGLVVLPEVVGGLFDSLFLHFVAFVACLILLILHVAGR